MSNAYTLISRRGGTTSSSDHRIFYADNYAGANFGEKVSAAITAAIAAGGGIVDARALAGSQTATAAFSVGSATVPVILLLGDLALTTAGSITVYRRSAIIGLQGGIGAGGSSYDNRSTIKQANAANLAQLIQLGDGTNNGTQASLEHLMVDGNRANNPTAGVNILVNKSARIRLDRVASVRAKTHGIHVKSTGTANESAVPMLVSVMSEGNGGNGLLLEKTNDAFIDLSEFENNDGYGIEGENSSAARIQHSDVSGSGEDGIYIHGTTGGLGATQWDIEAQFGNNAKHDIRIDGWGGTTIIGYGHQVKAKCIGSPARIANTYPSILVKDSHWNIIQGHLVSTTGHELLAGVKIVKTDASAMAPNILGPINLVGNPGSVGSPPVSYRWIYPANTIVVSAEAYNEDFAELKGHAIPNNDFLYFLDAARVARVVLYMGGNDAVYLRGHPTTKALNIEADPGNPNLALTASETISHLALRLISTADLTLEKLTAVKPMFTDDQKKVISGNIDLGASYVTGVLAMGLGGTGQTTAAGVRGAIDVYDTGSVDSFLATKAAAGAATGSESAHTHGFTGTVSGST